MQPDPQETRRLSPEPVTGNRGRLGAAAAPRRQRDARSPKWARMRFRAPFGEGDGRPVVPLRGEDARSIPGRWALGAAVRSYLPPHGICRRGDQARPPKSVHRKRCRARAELPCEHPPSQTHRLSSLVAGNGWSPERRGERVSHRPMDRDDAGLRLPDSKDPGERRRFTSSYGKNADSAEWTAAWAAREKPEKTF
ncbi:hypothetical protein MG293_002276 [Ovis ammon polii]|uniref:Uncharacterized protein n=1 Tax=Ovis ammon polii TaxID=230172 RepID=A0AAD4UGR4_OVIAM|nr:hypothetical protein MG293_002276 [Ovis ammon polii]